MFEFSLSDHVRAGRTLWISQYLGLPAISGTGVRSDLPFSCPWRRGLLSSTSMAIYAADMPLRIQFTKACASEMNRVECLRKRITYECK